MNLSRYKFWILLFFFASGSTGLIYEVVWTRLLTLVMGNTHYSIATVLTTFMAGLALGSYWGGRWIDRQGNPLMIYAFLEALIGIYCFLIPHLIDLALPLFKWIYINFQDSYTAASFLRFLICAAILILPASLMGATLPIMGKFVTRDPERIGREVGTLYAVNTLGAVVGAFVSAFVLMRLLGIQATIWVAAGLNLTIAFTIILFFRSPWSDRQGVASDDAATRPLSGMAKAVLMVFGFSGVTALVYQVAWNRIFSLLLGSSVYAFSLILTAFILGLALGTLTFSRWCNRFKDLLKVFGLLQLGIGLSALIAVPFFSSIPLVNRWVYLNWGLGFSSIQWANFLIIFTLIFIPTFLMGGQFPVVIKLVAHRLSSLGRHVGTAYACNTIGTIFGSFIGGFLLIPWLGVQKTIIAAILVNAVLGIFLLVKSKSLSIQTKYYVLPGVLLIFVFCARGMAPWDKAVISSGSFMPYRIADLAGALSRENKLLFYKEGIHTTVTTELAVTGNIFLRVNGKTDASLAMDMRTQLLSGYLPMFFHDDPKSVLVVGQGSGVTLGAVEQFPVREIDLVEISPAVIAGSRFFSPFNHQALDDSRVRLILEDGRHHLTHSDKKYDVIISEPSNPWISGVGALFTVEFYQKVKSRLNPGGIVCIWAHTNMSPESFKSIAKAFHSVFPFVTLWESVVGDDYLLIGSAQPYYLPYEKVDRYLRNSVGGEDLKRLGIGSVRDLMGLMMMDQSRLKKFIEGAPIHTDDNSLLEFGAPEYIYKDERHIIVRQLTPFFKSSPEFLKFSELEEGARDRVRKDIASLERTETQVKEIKRNARIDQFLDQAVAAVERGAYESAVQLYLKILRGEPRHVLTHLNLGNVFVAVQEYEKAEREYRITLEINPYYYFGAVSLARLYLQTGKPERAEAVLEKMSTWFPGDPTLMQLLKWTQR